MANESIRQAAKKAKVSLWKIADELSISEPTMTRKLRKELLDSEKTRFLEIILELSEKLRA